MARIVITDAASDLSLSIFYRDSSRGRHIIIPHFRERILWKLKYYLPVIYFIFMKNLVHKIVSY